MAWYWIVSLVIAGVLAGLGVGAIWLLNAIGGFKYNK